jgi:uncharacterized protein YfaS (alpha-2-macroglobulin family)
VLTAYGLMEFSDMARVHDVDPNVIERTRRWLLAQRQRDGSWEPDHGLHDDPAAGAEDARLATTAYIAWAVFSGGAAGKEAAPTLAYLKLHKPEDINDPHVLALVCNALLALDGSGEAAKTYLRRLESRKQSAADGQQFFWAREGNARTLFHGAGQAGQVETTALAALALIKGKGAPAAIRGALAWLVARKDPYGTWYSTQATVLSLKALIEGTGKDLGAGERLVVVRLGDWGLGIEIPEDQAEVLHSIDLTPHLGKGNQRLVLKEESQTGAGYQVALRYYLPEPPKAGGGWLGVDLKFGRNELRLNEVVPVKATVRNLKAEPAAMVMLELPLPPGFAAVDLAADLAPLQQQGRIARYQVQSGKVLLYLTELRRDKPLEVNYRLQALMPLRVQAPGARAYEYYAPEREAAVAGPVLAVRLPE